MTDPHAIGEKVLAGLAKGRAVAIAEARGRKDRVRETVLEFARRDQQAGNPERGRAVRIARALEGVVGASERKVRRLLRPDSLG